MGRSNSESPVRRRASPRKRSPPRRERSPTRHRNPNAEKVSSRDRSPKRAVSRSPARHSPVREKSYSRTKSPRHRRSPSPVRQKPSSRTRSPKRVRSRSPPPLSPPKEKPSSRTRSPKQVKSKSAASQSPRHRRSPSPVRQKPSSRTRSPKRVKSRSPPPLSPPKEKPSSRTRSPKQLKSRSSASQSPEKGKSSNQTRPPRSARSRSPESPSLSPRSKRLKRAKAERDIEREHEKNHGRKGDRATHDQKDLDTDLPIERKDRRLGRDAVGNGSRSRNRRSVSPSNHHRGRRRSRSPDADDNRGRDELTSSRHAEHRNGDTDSVAMMKAAEESLEAKEKEKQKPSFELSGKLAAETNRVRGVTLLFNEPPDARKPDVRWRLYVFKGGEVLNEPLYVHRQSCYLFGRERRIADIPTDHPSCSKQHAVLQYRQVEDNNSDGTTSKRVRPYLMDLGSTNGTFINDDKIEPERYYGLREKDTIKFGNSSREYVLLHENSAG